MTDLVDILQVLARWRLAVAVGAAAAIMVGLASGGVLRFGPDTAAPSRSGIAAAKILVDTHDSMVGDLNGGTEVIVAQSTLLAELLSDDAQKVAIARAAGVPLERLDVLVTAEEDPRTPSTLASKITGVTASSSQQYVVTIDPDSTVPIVSISTTAPDARAADGLARAATGALEKLVSTKAPTPARSLVAEQLGPVRSLEITDSSRRGPLLGIAAATAVFGLWCCAVVIFSGLVRRWRATPPASPRPA